jgi:hypothetical protein
MVNVGVHFFRGHGHVSESLLRPGHHYFDVLARRPGMNRRARASRMISQIATAEQLISIGSTPTC